MRMGRPAGQASTLILATGTCKAYGDRTAPARMRQEEEMHNTATTRTVLVWIGLVLGYVARVLPGGYSLLLLFVGLSLSVWGCYIWARLKNRSGYWCLFGLLTPIGLIALWKIKDKSLVGVKL